MNILKKKTIKRPIKKIFIRGLNWRVGDTLMCFPFMHELRFIFPQAQIDLAVPSDLISLYQGLKEINSLILIKKRQTISIKEKIKLWWKIRKTKYDLGISFQRSFEGALLLFLGAIPYRMGYASDYRGMLLTHSLSEKGWAMNKAKRHTAEYYLDILRAFFDHTPPHPSQAKRIKPIIQKKNLSSIVGKLNQKGIFQKNIPYRQKRDHQLGLTNPSEHINPNAHVEEVFKKWNFVLISPGSSYGPAKFWIQQRWCELLKKIKDSYPHMDIGFIGAPFDKEEVRSIDQKLSIKAFDLTGETTLGEFLVLIKYASLIITTDNGVSHLRSTYGGPLISLFGSTNHRLTGPYYTPEAIITKDIHCSPCLKPVCPLNTMECMKAISTEDVFKEVLSLLN